LFTGQDARQPDGGRQPGGESPEPRRAMSSQPPSWKGGERQGGAAGNTSGSVGSHPNGVSASARPQLEKSAMKLDTGTG
jgi:hypothetical protein